MARRFESRAGKLELRPRGLALEGWNGHRAASREIPYRELSAVRVARRVSECLDRQPTLVLERYGAAPIRIAGVAQTGIISELAEKIAAFQLGGFDVSRLAVVLPLKAGAREAAEALVSQGPPFDPEAAGLDLHEVLVTDVEAVFLFEAGSQEALDALVGDSSLWTAGAWDDLVAGPSRPAVEAYAWSRTEVPEHVSFAPTPGPGNSDGGDVFAP